MSLLSLLADSTGYNGNNSRLTSYQIKFEFCGLWLRFFFLIIFVSIFIIPYLLIF